MQAFHMVYFITLRKKNKQLIKRKNNLKAKLIKMGLQKACQIETPRIIIKRMEKLLDQRLQKFRSNRTATEHSIHSQNRKLRLSPEEIKALFDEPCFQDLNLQTLRTSHLLSLDKFQFLYQSFSAWNQNRLKKGSEWSSKQLGYFIIKIFEKIQRLNNLPFEEASLEIQNLYSLFNIEGVLKKIDNDSRMPRRKHSDFTSSVERQYLHRYQLRRRQIEKVGERKKLQSQYTSASGFKKLKDQEEKRKQKESIAKQNLGELIRQIKKNKSRFTGQGIQNYQFSGINPLRIDSRPSKYKINLIKAVDIEDQLKPKCEFFSAEKRQKLSDPTNLGLITLKPIKNHRKLKINQTQHRMRKKNLINLEAHF